MSQYFLTQTEPWLGFDALMSDDHTHASDGTARRSREQLSALSLT